MKVIDLLNKIANGEKPPKKIKYDNKICFYDEEKKDYYVNGDFCLCEDYISFNLEDLNDEVEIIEEDKKIEMLPMIEEDELYVAYLEINQTRRKINEIIDYINKENK